MPRPIEERHPEALEPYYCHGLDLQPRGEEYVCDCPICDAEGKFSVNSKTGQAHCWACELRCNAESFAAKLWEKFDKSTTNYQPLASMRGLETTTVMEWGACWSPIRRLWMLPGYNVRGEVRNLYRYAKAGEKMRLMGTKGMAHGLFGVNLYDKNKPNIFLLESWDALMMWEKLRQLRWTDDGYKPTAGNDNVLAEVNVLGLPGATSFRTQWAPLFAGKIVFLCLDNDHPRTADGRTIPSAGLSGTKRITSLLLSQKAPPADVRYLHWNSGGEDYHTSELPHGFDVTDAMREW